MFSLIRHIHLPLVGRPVVGFKRGTWKDNSNTLSSWEVVWARESDCVCSVDSWQLRAECLLEIQLSGKELPFPKSNSFPKGSPHIELYGCKGTKMSSYLSSMWGIYGGLSQLQTSLWQRSLLWLLKFNVAQSAFFTGVTTESFYQEMFSIQISVTECFLGNSTQDKCTLDILGSFLITLDPNHRDSDLIGLGESLSIFNTPQIILMCTVLTHWA